MSKRKRDEGVAFDVTFDDGSVQQIAIDTFTLRTGDHVARVIAREWQSGGRLPNKPIVSVKRTGRF